MKGFVLAFDPTIHRDQVERIQKRLLSFHTNVQQLRLTDLLVDTLTGGVYGDWVLIILAHCSIEAIGDKITYFGGCDRLNEKLHVVRRKVLRTFVAGCSTGNIDVSLCNTTYQPDFIGSSQSDLVSFVIDGGYPFPVEAPFIGLVTINWLIHFLTFMSLEPWKDFQWWNCKWHPIRELSYSSGFHDSCCQAFPELDWTFFRTRSRFSEKAVWIEANVRNLIWKRAFDDTQVNTILYPYRLSFPEIFHLGVFAAHYPQHKLTVEWGKGAIAAYCAYRKKTCQELQIKKYKFDKSVFVPTSDDANKWFSTIRSTSVENNVTSSTPRLTGDLVNAFKACLFHTIGEKLECTLKQSQNNLLRLLLGDCVHAGAPLSNTQTLAVVNRNANHNDVRVSGAVYYKVLEQIINRANIYKWRVVILDAALPDGFQLPEKMEIINASGHHHASRRNAVFPDFSEDADIIVSQLRFLRRCIIDFNITAAVGVHGGCLDVINALGVPPTSTLRFFGHLATSKGEANKQAEQIQNWKTRTDRLLSKFYDDYSTKWVTNGIPSNTSLKKFFIAEEEKVKQADNAIELAPNESC